MLDLDAYLPLLAGFEGKIPYMYLDTTGNVTVGVGTMLANVAAAQALPFVLRSDATTQATPIQIAADFNAVHQQPEGRNAQFYQQFTALTLPDDAIQAVLHSELTTFLGRLTASFPDFDSYPAPASAAILDMAYNLGLGGLLHGFPTFSHAVQNKDWATAAAQCHRIGIGTERNNWTHDQLIASVGA